MRTVKLQTALVLLVAVVATAALAGCSSGGKSSSSGSSASKTTTSSATTSKAAPHGEYQLVTITDKGFSPAKLTVPVGTRVVWANDGKTAHNVTFPDGTTSGNIPPGQRASHIFNDFGTFPYEDTLHSLKGSVSVQ
jgi:plastocyanin